LCGVGNGLQRSYTILLKSTDRPIQQCMAASRWVKGNVPKPSRGFRARVPGAGLSSMKRKTSRRIRPAGKANPRRWSAQVMKTSNALDLEPGVFTRRSPRAIAASLKRSALESRRRKAEPFRSAMSMLNFHINRSGRSLTAERRHILERAKVELRRLFDRKS
jgi:Protein of unknown function (DUF3175)